MKVVIFAGGTGSIALQRGLYHALEMNFDGVEIKIVVNAYDNGLSTGTVRRVMDGKILGPSDVRKNHATRLALADPDSPWLSFLNCRFTIESSCARDFSKRRIVRLFQDLERRGSRVDGRSTLVGAIDAYFKSPLAAAIEYRDFSLPNIIYAGIARENGNSLRKSARIMAEVMGIPDCVLLNDDESLYLGAITQSGRRVRDEGEIVSWGNEADPFVDVFFTDVGGNECQPHLCLEAWRAILESDLIILSPGTQWSSLIPTYASIGFRAAVSASKAKVLMVMNRIPDRDCPGQTASDIINILVPRYFDAGRVHVIADVNGYPTMRTLSQSALERVASFTADDVSTRSDPAGQHDPKKLADSVSHIFFREYLESDFYLFDYDDTLVDRDGKLQRSSNFNVQGVCRLNYLTNVAICTGNTIRALKVRDEPERWYGTRIPVYRPLLVFADGGVNAYSYDTRRREMSGTDNKDTLVKCICPSAQLSSEGPYSAEKIVKNLQRAGIPASTIDVRGNVIIAIRPVPHDYRGVVLQVVKSVVHGSDLEVRECGRTTVEICRPTLSKTHVLRHLYPTSQPRTRITYVGDECESGNDSEIAAFAQPDFEVRCLQVSDPAKTAFFISTLLGHLTPNGKH